MSKRMSEEPIEVIARRLLQIDEPWPNMPEPSVEMGLSNFANGLVAGEQWTIKRLWQPDPAGGHRIQPALFDLLEILRRAASGRLDDVPERSGSGKSMEKPA